MNVDAAIDFSRRRVAIGLIARNNAGLRLVAKSIHIGFCSPLFAELCSIKFVREWAWRQGFKNVAIETDSELACRIPKKSMEWKGNQKALVWSVNSLITQDWHINISHIYREANQSAHWLARKGLGFETGSHNFHFCIPPVLGNLVYSDNRGVYYLDLINKTSYPVVCLEANLVGLLIHSATCMLGQPSYVRLCSGCGHNSLKKNGKFLTVPV